MMLPPGWPRLRSAVLFLYSIAVMTTILPGFNVIPHLAVMFYFLLFPGYAFSLILGQANGIIQTAFYSLVWSVAILGSIYSLGTVTPALSKIPVSGIIPVLTIISTAYAFYHEKELKA
jgi:hypothetical protein